MPNRLDLRAALRRRLEDTAATPLWDDDTLNELLADALRHYGVRFPAERTVVVAVSDGDMTIPVDPELGISEVVAVRDPNGAVVPRSNPPQGWLGVVRQTWSFWNGSVHLTASAVSGDWEVDALFRRELVGNDVDEVDIRAGDEAIVVLLAAAGALLRRAVELSKRGAETGGLTLTRVADRHSREAEVLMASRRRRASGGWLSG